jgi:hypothetical protein
VKALLETAIEAADVRPEIEAAMVSVDLGVEQITIGSVSLAPTPSMIPAIGAKTAETSRETMAIIDEC